MQELLPAVCDVVAAPRTTGSFLVCKDCGMKGIDTEARRAGLFIVAGRSSSLDQSRITLPKAWCLGEEVLRWCDNDAIVLSESMDHDVHVKQPVTMEEEEEEHGGRRTETAMNEENALTMLADCATLGERALSPPGTAKLQHDVLAGPQVMSVYVDHPENNHHDGDPCAGDASTLKPWGMADEVLMDETADDGICDAIGHQDVSPPCSLCQFGDATHSGNIVELKALYASLVSRRKGQNGPRLWTTNAYRSPEEVDQLLEGEGVSLPPGRTTLHRAVFEKDYYLVGLLMLSKYRDLLNELDTLERTPLHLAVLEADPIAVQLLLGCPLEAEEDPALLVFPDVSLPFAQLPITHLPLAAAVSPHLLSIETIYRFLLSYINLLTQVRQGKQFLVVDEFFGTACSWLHHPGVVSSEASHSMSTSAPSQQQDHHEFPQPLQFPCSALSDFLETRRIPPLCMWGVNAVDRLGYTALHRASSMGLTSVVQLLLNAGADPLIKDCYGDLPVHHAIDSGNETTFAIMLRRGALAGGGDPLSEETSIMALFKRCILRLGRLIMDEVYSQYPISELDFDHLAEFANSCGFSKEFATAFNLAVDGSIPPENGSSECSAYSTRVKIYTHDYCLDHLPLPPSHAKKVRLCLKYPENPTRLQCLIPEKTGILRSPQLSRIPVEMEAPPACIADILRVHEWGYVRRLISRADKVAMEAELFRNTRPYPLEEIDGDTPVTPGSWQAACAAAGTVIAAAHAVCMGETRAAFCAVRPPGHHVGTWGPCQLPFGNASSNWEPGAGEEDWLFGSQGFCLLNNVAIGAAYTRYRFGPEGIRRIAIVDFDVHHGNGTEQIVRNLTARTRQLTLPTSRSGDFSLTLQYAEEFWKPWWNESDPDEVFFVSIHGFAESFYPGTGGNDPVGFPNIRNAPLPRGTTQQGFRTAFQEQVIRPLSEFGPDIIFISAGFDAHSMDLANDAFGGCSEVDFEWMTRYLIAVANDFCEGRLEGGYNTKAGALSPLALSAAAHVRVLQESSPVLSLVGVKALPAPRALTSEDVPTVFLHHEHWEHGTGSNDETAPKRRRRAAAIKALAQIEQHVQHGPGEESLIVRGSEIMSVGSGTPHEAVSYLRSSSVTPSLREQL